MSFRDTDNLMTTTRGQLRKKLPHRVDLATLLSMTNLMEEFWSKVDKREQDECWPWTGESPKFRGHHAHVVACASRDGVPNGLYTLHACDNPPCCNPNHLRQGTHQDNIRDMVERKRCGKRYGQPLRLVKADADEIRKLEGEHTREEIADIMGTCVKTITNTLKRYPCANT